MGIMASKKTPVLTGQVVYICFRGFVRFCRGPVLFYPVLSSGRLVRLVIGSSGRLVVWLSGCLAVW